VATNPGRGFAAGVEDAIYYAAVIGGVVWVLEMARITAAMDRPTPQVWVGWCGVALLGAAVIAIAVTRRIGLLAFALTLLGAVVSIAVISVDDGQSILKPIYAATSPAVLVPAAIAVRRRSMGLISAAAVILLVELTIVVPTTSLTWSRTFFVVVWSAVVGLFVRWLISALRASAIVADATQAASLVAVREQAETRARASETARLGRLLHDTLINTMGAIRDGVAAALEPQLRDRCRADLAQVHSARVEGRGLAVVHANSVQWFVDECQELARVRGLTLTVRSSGTDSHVAPDVLDRVRDICGEAMTNIVKHSGVDTCELDVMAGEGQFDVEVRDAGRGFDQDVVTVGGIDASMRVPALEVGLELALVSTPGIGTTVRLRWRQPQHSIDEVQEMQALQEHPVFPVRGGLMLWLVCGLTLLQALVQAPGQSWVNVVLYASAALAMGVALLVALREARARGAVGPFGAISLIAAGAYGVWASSSGQGLCSPDPAIWVGSTTVLVAIAVLAVVSQHVWWLLGAWLAGLAVLTLVAIDGAGPGCSAYVSVLDGSQVIAFVLGVVFVWAAMRAQRRVAAAQHQLEDATTAVALERARVSRYERRLEVAAQIAVPLFDGIVSGQRRALDPDVRAVAARQEVIVRSIAQLPDVPDTADKVLLELLTTADLRGIAMKIVVIGDRTESLAVLVDSGIAIVLTDVVAALQPGDRVAVSFVVSDSTREVRLAADTTGARTLRLAPAAELTVRSVVTDDQIAVIVNWPDHR